VQVSSDSDEQASAQDRHQERHQQSKQGQHHGNSSFLQLQLALGLSEGKGDSRRKQGCPKRSPTA
jgi:hypothetical protein